MQASPEPKGAHALRERERAAVYAHHEEGVGILSLKKSGSSDPSISSSIIAKRNIHDSVQNTMVTLEISNAHGKANNSLISDPTFIFKHFGVLQPRGVIQYCND